MPDPEIPDAELNRHDTTEDRREVLKRLAAGMAGSAFLAGLPWFAPLRAAPAGTAASDTVRIGMIGVGSRGQLLLDHLLRTPGVAITGLCDVQEQRLAEALERVGKTVPLYNDHRRLLESPDIDAVVIATPLYLHAPQTLAALDAGKHAFCEKSLALTIDECKAVARAADQSPMVFQIGHQRLFHVRYLDALKRVTQGDLGPVTQMRAFWHRNLSWRQQVATPEMNDLINWRLYRRYSAGLMTELASHHLHIANWFLGTPPLSCIGYGSINHWKDDREVFDNVNVIYRYPGGVHFVYDSLSSNAFHGLEMQIMGSKGTLEMEEGWFYPETVPPAPGIVQLLQQIERGVKQTIPIGGHSWSANTRAEGVALPDTQDRDDGTGLSLAAFVSAIRQGQRMPYMVDHAYRSGVAALMGQMAMEEGREVLWPGDFRA